MFRAIGQCKAMAQLVLLLGKLLRIRELDAQIERLWLLASGNRTRTHA